jgi:hypothetical protein
VFIRICVLIELSVWREREKRDHSQVGRAFLPFVIAFRDKDARLQSYFVD